MWFLLTEGRQTFQYSPPSRRFFSVSLSLFLMCTEGFLEFLFSDHWEEGCLLRVLKGKLLDNLLHALNQLESHHDIISYTTMAYIYNQDPLLPCIKITSDNHQLRNVSVLRIYKIDERRTLPILFRNVCPDSNDKLIGKLTPVSEISSGYRNL